MSTTSRKLCYLVLNEVFGDLVAGIGDKLHQWNGQTLQQLFIPPRIPKTAECLAVLINHNIVKFQECPRTGKVIYYLKEDRVIALIKFPRYLILTKTLFGDEAELLVEEMFKLGQCSMTSVIFKAAKRLKMAKKEDFGKTENVIKTLKNKFGQLVDCQFLQRIPSPYSKAEPNPPLKTLPELSLAEETKFFVPELNFKLVIETIEKLNDEETEIELENDTDKILWRVNYERFSRELRDQVIVEAVTKRIDSSAGDLMRLMLQIMNENQPWAGISCHIRFNEIQDRLDKNLNIDRDLKDFKDQYFKILEEDRTRFLDRVGDAGGGEYVINAKHIFTELAAATIESIILERFGSKALRIFRVVRQKLHVEESTLQNLVMIPAKETKLFSFYLQENNFIKLQELRKSMASNMGKTFFMFYVDLPQVARMVKDLCHKAIANSFTRKKHETDTNQRLLDKYERIESIAANLKASPDFEESEDLQLQFQEVQDMVSQQFLFVYHNKT